MSIAALHQLGLDLEQLAAPTSPGEADAARDVLTSAASEVVCTVTNETPASAATWRALRRIGEAGALIDACAAPAWTSGPVRQTFKARTHDAAQCLFQAARDLGPKRGNA